MIKFIFDMNRHGLDRMNLFDRIGSILESDAYQLTDVIKILSIDDDSVILKTKDIPIRLEIDNLYGHKLVMNNGNTIVLSNYNVRKIIVE